MGRRIRVQRKGRGSIFQAHTTGRRGAPMLRTIDAGEKKGYVKGVVREIMHDKGRGAPLVKVQYRDMRKFGKSDELMVAVEGMYVGQPIYSGKKAELHVGNVMPIGQVPEGTYVANIEAKVGDRGVLARTSGTYATVISHNTDTNRTRIRLPSGDKKVVVSTCRAMIGIIAGGGRTDKPMLKAGNAFYKYKAKRNCWPVMRGVAMNPVDHPYGGGNHQHIGFGSCTNRNAVAGQKIGLIAARQSGRGGSRRRV
ncbi:ribosomal protein L2 [Kipferlia bialata]|uniref:Ribosomal protein L2 n=1 Tax=Kipferlia bialata TaxID=797122 RepID=A0A391P0Y1_9EUKA|nr:ribosomal protein L2 [Kipferlia bialata]|eukprot:g2728.t1